MKVFFFILILLKSVICLSNNNKDTNTAIAVAPAKPAVDIKKIALATKYFSKKKCLKMTKLLQKDLEDLNLVWLKKMAYCFKKIKNLKQEKIVYSQILNKNSKDYLSHFKLAELYQTKGLDTNTPSPNNPLATKHFKLAIQSKQNFVPAYLALFNIFKVQKNYYDIQVFAETLLKIKPNNKIALNQLCFSYFKQNYIKETIKMCQQAIKYNVKNPLADNLVYLAVSLNKKDKNSGKQLLLKTEKTFSTSLLATEQLANYFYQEKNYLLSSQYYKKVLNLKSKNFSSLTQAVWSFFKNNNYQLSLTSLKQLCLINKQHAVHLMRTVISKLEGKNQKKWIQPYKLSLAKDCY